MTTAQRNGTSTPPVVALGASAGGVDALRRFVAALPSAFPGAVFVVLHVSPAGTSVLPDILDRAGRLPAAAGVHGEPVVAGRVYVAPSDRHLLVEDGRIALSAGPRVNGHRPSVDTTFSSVAAAYGAHATGVILSGTLDDGTRGLFEIKAAGGLALVQDPDEALHAGMIKSALRRVDVDATLGIRELADAVVRRANERHAMPPVADPSPSDDERVSATRFTCPDCGGALWRREQAGSLRYTCSIGHAYGPDTLDNAQGRDVEAALWAAVRMLGDRESLLAEMASRAEAEGRPIGAEGFRERANEAAHAAATLRRLVESGLLPLAAQAAAGD